MQSNLACGARAFHQSMKLPARAFLKWTRWRGIGPFGLLAVVGGTQKQPAAQHVLYMLALM